MGVNTKLLADSDEREERRFIRTTAAWGGFALLMLALTAGITTAAILSAVYIKQNLAESGPVTHADLSFMKQKHQQELMGALEQKLQIHQEDTNFMGRQLKEDLNFTEQNHRMELSLMERKLQKHLDLMEQKLEGEAAERKVLEQKHREDLENEAAERKALEEKHLDDAKKLMERMDVLETELEYEDDEDPADYVAPVSYVITFLYFYFIYWDLKITPK